MNATMGAPVGIPGNGPEDPAISRWEYGNGLFESIPCWKRIQKHKWWWSVKHLTVLFVTLHI